MSTVLDKVISYANAHIGDRYSQANRFGDHVYDCSSLVYRAFQSAGVTLRHRSTGAVVNTSNTEVYAKGFTLIYPNSYSEVGKYLPAPSGTVNKIQSGDIVFYNTQKTKRENKITHVAIAVSSKTIIHARNPKYGVVQNSTSLNASNICAIIRYGNGTVSGVSTHNKSNAKQNYDPSEEIKYLKKYLKTKSESSKKIHGEVIQNKQVRLKIELIIAHDKKLYLPPVLDGVNLCLERAGAPGKLTFKIYMDKKIIFQEGDAVRLRVNDKNFFYGFIFAKSPDKDNVMSITAYDQLRYLKNKDTYVYKNKKASDVVKMIAGDFGLQCGKIEDTSYVIKKAVEDNQALFDIIQNALDETILNTGKMYVLYDNSGKLMLENIEKMRINLVIDKETGETYDYTTSIDGSTYNKIKLTYENEKKKTRDVYIAQSSRSINKWGVLQYYDTIKSPELGKIKSNALLSMYNKKERRLSIKGVFGDIRVRAGTSLPVMLSLPDKKVCTYLVVEKVTHTFNNNEHKMDLTLRGGGFDA